jgi:hypothetical protein
MSVTLIAILSIVVVLFTITIILVRVAERKHQVQPPFILKSFGSVTIPAIPGEAKVLTEVSRDIWCKDIFKRWIANGLDRVSDLPQVVWQSFELVVELARVSHMPQAALDASGLAGWAWDNDIVSELPASYVFKNRHQLCAYLAHLINLQPNGEVGLLLSNGFANIFFAEDCNGVVRTVSVLWDSEWIFDAHEFNHCQWFVGCRVFVPTAGPSAG